MKLKNYLFVWIIICDYCWLFICVDDYLQLFVIIAAFGVKKCFLLLFVIIDDYLWLFVIVYLCKEFFFVKNIFIIITSMDKWASWLKMIKQKIQDFMIWKF